MFQTIIQPRSDALSVRGWGGGGGPCKTQHTPVVFKTATLVKMSEGQLKGSTIPEAAAFLGGETFVFSR